LTPYVNPINILSNLIHCFHKLNHFEATVKMFPINKQSCLQKRLVILLPNILIRGRIFVCFQVEMWHLTSSVFVLCKNASNGCHLIFMLVKTFCLLICLFVSYMSIQYQYLMIRSLDWSLRLFKDTFYYKYGSVLVTNDANINKIARLC
jgi:hypothetical protein